MILFKSESLRKTAKSALAKVLRKTVEKLVVVSVPKFYVLDGGCLLHRCIWNMEVDGKPTSYACIVRQYVAHVVEKYGSNCVIVFDGYGNGATIKDHEHARRASKSCPDIDVTAEKTVYRNQSAFLTNSNNKVLFVALLSEGLRLAGCTVCQATDDADTLIVKTALDHAKSDRPVTVVADDTDILVMLVHHFTDSMADIYMQSLNAKTSIRAVRDAIKLKATEQLLVIHAISGCDTTSALFGHGKASIYRQISSHPDTLTLTRAISAPTATCESVAQAGKQLLKIIYGGKLGETLNKLRYVRYMQLVARSVTRPRPERLPPTERAAYYHLLRVHLQVMQWQTLRTDCLDADKWGWKLHENVYVPIGTDDAIAPDDMLTVILCSCNTDSSKGNCRSKACTCRKYGLHCMPACKNCYGELCTNAAPQTVPDIAVDSDSDDETVCEPEDDTVCATEDATACEDGTDAEQDFEVSHDQLLDGQIVEVDGCDICEDMWFDDEIVDNVTYLDV